jgi:hypothetical protein
MAQRTIPTPPGLDEQGNPVDTETLRPKLRHNKYL